MSSIAKASRSSPSKEPTFKLHAGQDVAWQALNDPAIREIALVAGIQGGKTSFGALATMHMFQKWSQKYPGCNFIVAADNYKTLSQATIPTFRKVFTKYYGRYIGNKEEFELKKGGKVFFRTATDPNSIEGVPDCVFVWIDEAGKCSRLFKINAEGRVARLQGKVLYTSTPYAMNWLFTEVERPFLAGERPDICFVRFSSMENPSFPREEFERQRKILDARTFRRKYMGIHERMEGLVYELTSENFVEPHTLPRGTRFFAGVDFGYAEGHEFALTVRAITPERNHFVVSVFKQSGLDPEKQVNICQSKMNTFHVELFYCDPSRPDLISLLNKHGVPAVPFHTEGSSVYKQIMPGVNAHQSLIKTGRYKIFKGQCADLEDEYETYHFPENKDGIIPKEQPVKLNDNLMDAERMVTIGTLNLTIKSEKPIMGSRTYPHIDRFDPTKKSRKNAGWESY